MLAKHAIDDCGRLGLNALFALLLDVNSPSIRLLERHGFTRWGHLPDVADLGGGRRCGQFIYGINLDR